MPELAKGKAPGARTLRSATAKITEPKDARPTRFTYALGQWSAERRTDGWYVSPTAPSLYDKSRHRGPFDTIETACLSIARSLAVELADRHSRSIEFPKLDPAHPLYGLKPQTRLAKRGKAPVT